MKANNGGNKRPDIQLLRAVAIIGVLTFHLRPELMPQGYLGVDMFFVISGYLMTAILAFGPERRLTRKTVLLFYQRRVKRLLPAYMLVVAGVLAVGTPLLIATDFSFLRTDALWAVLFGTNVQSMVEQRTYFLLVSEYKFFLHTWSLSVELQYYALAPFLLAAVAFSRNPLLATVGASVISFAFQTTIPAPTVAFGFVVSRIWQFFVGTLVYYAEKRREAARQRREDEEALLENGKELSECSAAAGVPCVARVLVWTAAMAICAMPELSTTAIYTNSVRAIATLLAGAAMFQGSPPEWCSGSGCSSWIIHVLVYIGDISYSLYLVHWPIVIFAKYLLLWETTSIFVLLILIFALSITQYHAFEKVMLKRSTTTVGIVCAVLYGFVFIILTQPQGLGIIKPHTLHPSVEANQLIAHNCNRGENNCNWDPEMMKLVRKPTKGGAYFCSYESQGPATAMFTGNSFALRQLEAMRAVLKGRIHKLYYAARPACLSFELFNEGYGGYWQCDEIRNKTFEFVQKFRPDFLIITQKLSGNNRFKKYVESIDAAMNDTATQQMADYFKLWSPFVKRIFVIEPHATLAYSPPYRLAKLVSQNQPIDDYFIPRKKLEREVDPGWFKVQAAMRSCPKCRPIHLRDQFCTRPDKCDVYEEKTKLSLYCDNGHFSPHGVERMEKPLKEAIDTALKELQQEAEAAQKSS